MVTDILFLNFLVSKVSAMAKFTTVVQYTHVEFQTKLKLLLS